MNIAKIKCVRCKELYPETVFGTYEKAGKTYRRKECPKCTDKKRKTLQRKKNPIRSVKNIRVINP